MGIEFRLAAAREQLPDSRLTTAAVWVSTILRGAVGLLLLPVQIVFMLAHVILNFITLTLWTLIASVLLLPGWLLLLGLLLGSSWLWLRVPLVRGVVLIPGVLVNVIANEYLLLALDEPESRTAKFALVESWPLTWLAIKPQPATERECHRCHSPILPEASFCLACGSRQPSY